MEKFNYVSVDTIFAKVLRDFRGMDISESDIVEWVGEALGFMRTPGIHEEAVAFIEVRNHRCDMPEGMKVILQVARNNSWTDQTASSNGLSPQVVIEALACEHPCPDNGLLVDPDTGIPDDSGIFYYRPYFDLKYEYQGWCGNTYYRENYTPVRLSNQTFFRTLVAQETSDQIQDVYRSNTSDEYTSIGGCPSNCLLFSFESGSVAVSYVRSKVDEATGYPLIPDDISFISACTYYIKWKMAERNRWNGVEGANLEVQDAEKNWKHYIRQAINRSKMPSTIDEYQDIMEQSLHLIPRTRNYYGFFGNLGREENRRFNNPDGRRRFTYNRYNYGYQ